MKKGLKRKTGRRKGKRKRNVGLEKQTGQERLFGVGKRQTK